MLRRSSALHLARVLPWARLTAALCFVGGSAALGWGFGLVFLTHDPTPRLAAVGFAVMGIAGVLFALTAGLLGLRKEP